jgi:hypothetical protein
MVRKNAHKGGTIVTNILKTDDILFFSQKYFRFSKMDKNKCPKMKNPNIFPKKN